MTTEMTQERVLRVLLLGERIEEFRHVRELLHDQGAFHVNGARDAAHAVALMVDETYDTLLVDAAIWEESGMVLLEQMREHLPDAALVVITEGDASDKGPSRGLAHGAHEVLRRETLNDGSHLARRIIEAVGQVHSHSHGTMLRWLEQDARTDALTGLHNRHAFDERLAECCEASNESGSPVTVVLTSIWGWRSINKTYGNSAGDELLRRAASCVMWCIRGQDLAARIDSDTIAILVDGADLDLGQTVARRIVHRMHQENLKIGLRSAPIEAAFGIASGTAAAPEKLVGAAMKQIAMQKADQERPVPFLYPDEEEGPSVA